MDTKPCFLVNNLTDVLDQCDFLNQNDCLATDSVIDYVKLIYCDIGNNYEFEGIILLVVILIILFIGLGAAANEFLCPSLLALAKILGMSDSVAGVTLLAFGNGCPDIFSSLAAASDDRPELIIGELLGAGIFCTSIVSGLIFISNDFALACRPMLRDTIFYLVSAYLVWLCCWYGEIKFLYSVGFIGIYIVYLTVALVGQALHRRQRARDEKNSKSKQLNNGGNNIKNSITGNDNRAFVDDFDKKKNKSDDNNNKQQQQQVKKEALCAVERVQKDGTEMCMNNGAKEEGKNNFGERNIQRQQQQQQNENLFTIIKSPRNTIMPQLKLSSLSDEYNDNTNVTLKRYSTLSKDMQERKRSTQSRRKSSTLHKHLENSLLAMTEFNRNNSDESGCECESNKRDYPETSTNNTTLTTVSSTSSKSNEDKRVSIAVKWIDIDSRDGVTNGRKLSHEDGNFNSNKKYDNYGSILPSKDASTNCVVRNNSDRSIIKICGPSTIVLDSSNCNQHQQQERGSHSDVDDINLRIHTIEQETKVQLSASDLASQTDLNEWDDFLLHVSPIDVHNWRDATLLNKIFELARAPIFFFMLITIPVLDYGSKRHNWCRILNSIHCITVPIAITMLTQTAQMETFVFGLPLYSITILPGFLLAIILVKTSNYLIPPRYHQIFAYIGFLMSIIWIYSLANEVINLLKTIGIIFSLSDAAIGLGILAWGNSLGDIVANLTLARSGYPRMAIGACIGAPLLNLLLGFGLSFSISLGPRGTSLVEYSTMTTLLYATITTVLISLMLSTLVPANISKKYYGYTLILMYLVYFVMAICIEYGLLFT